MSLSLLLCIQTDPAAASDLSVRPTGRTAIEARPGTRLTLGFLVSNLSALERPVWTSVTIPPQWRIVVPDAPFSLAAGGTDLRLVTLVIPPTAPEGIYQIQYAAAPADTPLDSTTSTIQVRIPATRQLQLQVAEAPRDAVAGSSFRIRYRVANGGNTLEIVRLRAVSLQPGFDLRLEPSMLQLAPQEIRDVVVEVGTPPESDQVYHCRIDLIAQLQSDTTVVQPAFATVRLIPSPKMVEARYHNIPFVARLRWGGEGDRSGPQVELMGSGALSSDGSNRIEMLIRTPDLQQKTLLGYRDEYRLEYDSRDLKLYAGDRNYMLSPLTEYGRYAFGAGGSFHTGGVSVTAFANRDRFLSSHPREAAASAGYEISPRTLISMNYLHRENDRVSNIVTARGIFRDLWHTDGDVEIGRDFGEGKDNALGLHWWGRDRWGSFAVRYIRAGPRYDAYYSDVDFKSASVTIAQTWPFRFDANYRDDKRNLDLDTSRYSAPRSTYFDIGIGYKDYVTVEYRYNRYRDDLPGASFARKLTTILVQTGYNSPFVGILAQFEFGTEKDDYLGASSIYRRYALISSLAPSMYQSYGVSLEYQRNNDMLTGEPLDRLSGSIRAGLNIPGGTRLLAHFFSGRSLVNANGGFTYLDLSIEQTLPFGHILGARARHSISTPSSEPENLAYLFEYGIPFAVPLRISANSGIVRGSLRDAVTGQPLPGAIMTLDNLAVLTDGDGEFLFPDVRAGQHILDVDPAAIPRGYIPVPRLPLEVGLVDGEPREVALTLVRGASATGIATIDTTSMGPDSTIAAMGEGSPLPNILLELSSGNRMQRQRTASDGRFDFLGLPPGQWQLRVLPESVPPGYSIRMDTAVFILRPGERQEIHLQARPVQRQIRMIEEGKILIDTSRSSSVLPPASTPESRKAPPAPSALVIRSGRPPRYSVQISSWRSRDKASAQAAQYSRALDAKVSTTAFRSKSGKTGYRVMAGPYATKAEAEAVAQRLRGK